MDGLPIAAEFRHGSWLTPDKAPSTLQFLAAHDITYVTADEPQYGNLSTIPFISQTNNRHRLFQIPRPEQRELAQERHRDLVTVCILVLRRGATDFVPHLEHADKKTKVTYAMFNNCHRNYAVANATQAEGTPEKKVAIGLIVRT